MKRALLGTMLDGDLFELTSDGPRGPLGRLHFVGFTFQELCSHALIIGGTGTGKTVTQLRLASSVLALARTPENQSEPPPRIIFVDAKGLAQGDRDHFVTAMRLRGAVRVASWPDSILAGFDGTAFDIRERVSGLFHGNESPFHHAEAVAMLDLALEAGLPPRSLDELTYRTRPGVTAALYEQMGTTTALDKRDQAKSFSANQWNSVYLRLRALMATVGDGLDSSPSSFRLDEVDAAWISIPGTTAPQTAGDLASWLLALIAGLAQSEQRRATLIILDEFSAVGQDVRASKALAGLLERTRSAKIAIVVGAQSLPSLGEQVDRLVHTVGTVICHRSPAPEAIVELAGTVPVWEDTLEIHGFGQRMATSGRRQNQFRISPNLVRQLPVGECVVVHQGLWAHVAVAGQR
jgi:hypothetical protein